MVPSGSWAETEKLMVLFFEIILFPMGVIIGALLEVVDPPAVVLWQFEVLNVRQSEEHDNVPDW